MVNGKYLVTNGMQESNTSYRIYDMLDDGKAAANGMTALHVKEQESFSGAFENDLLQEGEVSATFTQLYNKASSLEYIYGDVNTSKANMTISKTGVVSGVVNDCQVDGNISTPDKSVNMYKLEITFSTCDKSGVYKGLGVVVLDNNNSAYFLGLGSNEDSSRMEVFFNYLYETPSVFTQSAELNSTTSKQVKARVNDDMPNDCNNINTNNIDEMDYSNKNLEECDLSNISAFRTSFRNSNLMRANFTDAYLYNSYFHDANLEGSNFNSANLHYSTLNFAKMMKVDFSNADLRSAGFIDADLTGANFNNADISDAYFWGSNLTYSNFEGAKKSHYAQFKTSSYSKVANLSNAWWIDGKRCSATSITGICYQRDADNTLTYDEYINGKKENENILKEVESGLGKLVDEGSKLLNV
jgi:uncharacterized protein YjbI with pentapeptide repeats